MVNLHARSKGYRIAYDLSYNHVLALLTLVATTVVITLILFRAIIRLEEMGADV